MKKIKYEVYEALAERGSKENVGIISKGFRNEKDDDVRVAASNAFLANEHYCREAGYSH